METLPVTIPGPALVELSTERSPGARFLALGDSYTIGEGVSPEERWPVQLASRLREESFLIDAPVIIACTGWTTADLDAALDSMDPPRPFDLVTLLIGVNDQYRGQRVDDYQPKFQALLERAVVLTGGKPERVIVLSIPDWSVTPFAVGRDQPLIAAEIDSFNRANRAAALQAGAQYIDITGISRQASEDLSLLAGDGLHPSGKMYAAWVDLVLPAALDALSR